MSLKDLTDGEKMHADSLPRVQIRRRYRGGCRLDHTTSVGRTIDWGLYAGIAWQIQGIRSDCKPSVRRIYGCSLELCIVQSSVCTMGSLLVISLFTLRDDDDEYGVVAVSDDDFE